MAKKIKYRKGNSYFESNSKNIDYDFKYDTPELEAEWDALLLTKQEQDRIDEEALIYTSPPLDEIIRSVVLQMIEDGIVKEGQDYEPPEE